MIPIHLDPAQVSIALAGQGELAVKRLAWLRAGGADPRVFSQAPSDELVLAAGSALQRRAMQGDDLATLDLLWIADLVPAEAEALFHRARAHKVVTSVEDVNPLCQFHVPALVRRGKLTVSVGTAGASPAVARAVRAKIDAALPGDWARVLEEVAAERLAARAAGAGPGELLALADLTLKRWGLVD